jgi:hypothetical protein
MNSLLLNHREYSGIQATKNRAKERGFFKPELLAVQSALTRLEAGIGLVDHIDASTTAHNLATATTLLECLQRTCDLHWTAPVIKKTAQRGGNEQNLTADPAPVNAGCAAKSRFIALWRDIRDLASGPAPWRPGWSC